MQVENIPKVVTACCVLHNICFLQDQDEMDVSEFVDDSDGDMKENDSVNMIKEQSCARNHCYVKQKTATAGFNARMKIITIIIIIGSQTVNIFLVFRYVLG